MRDGAMHFFLIAWTPEPWNNQKLHTWDDILLYCIISNCIFFQNMRKTCIKLHRYFIKNIEYTPQILIR